MRNPVKIPNELCVEGSDNVCASGESHRICEMEETISRSKIRATETGEKPPLTL
jgi:hypothetical protein